MKKQKAVVVDERPVSDSFYDADSSSSFEEPEFEEEELNAFDEKHEFWNPSLDSLNGGKYGYDDEQY